MKNYKKKENFWISMWVAEQPLFKHALQVERLLHCRHIIGNSARDHLFTSENGTARMYITEAAIEDIKRDGAKLLYPMVAKRTMDALQKTIEKFWKTTKQLRALSDGDTPLFNKAMAQRFSIFNQALLKIFAYFLTTWEPTTRALEQRLRTIIEKKYPHDPEDIFTTLITPSEGDLLLHEKISWAHVLKNPNEQSIRQHTLQFPFLFTNIDREQDALNILRQRLKTNRIVTIQKEIQTSKKRLQQSRTEQSALLKKLASVEARSIARVIQQFALFRLQLKNCWAGVHFYLFPLFARIAQTTRQEIRDVMMFWSMDDILRFLKKEKVLSHAELKERKDCYLLLYRKRKVTFSVGVKARKKRSALLDASAPPAETAIVHGVIANKGRARGIVRVIDFDDLRRIEKEARHITRKFILVTGMTNPNMIPLIKKATAIVTDEGGITCHAAIISREFRIPCVIATRIATQIFKNGDTVEVDANTGIVKKYEH